MREAELSWSSVADARFERRLRLGLVMTFLFLAAVLVGFGVWFERPFAAAASYSGSDSAAGNTQSLSLEVSR